MACFHRVLMSFYLHLLAIASILYSPSEIVLSVSAEVMHLEYLSPPCKSVYRQVRFIA